MTKLVISKQLRAEYAKPQQIAHKVLADRINEREEGGGPKPGDRIRYVYIEAPDTVKLQGDRIETPEFVAGSDGAVRIDYAHYITNQLMKPVGQIFALVLERIWQIQRKASALRNYTREVEALRAKNAGDDAATLGKKIDKLRMSRVQELLFDTCLRELNNRKRGVQDISSFFSKKRKAAT